MSLAKDELTCFLGIAQVNHAQYPSSPHADGEGPHGDRGGSVSSIHKGILFCAVQRRHGESPQLGDHGIKGGRSGFVGGGGKYCYRNGGRIKQRKQKAWRDRFHPSFPTQYSHLTSSFGLQGERIDRTRGMM